MANSIKDQEDILAKLNIHQLNPMQEEAIAVIDKTTNTILLSPTGTGKTLAFLLPLLKTLDATIEEVQALIVVPSRELAIQIEQVLRIMGTGFKVNAVYGGRTMAKDKLELKHNPAILIGTPGRILDHFMNDRFSKDSIKTLVLDEFDKCLDKGFSDEMKGIIASVPRVNKRILTSATQNIEIPSFVRLDKPVLINYLKQKKALKLDIKTVISPLRNKSQTLLDLVLHLGNEQGIVFCNVKENIEYLDKFLTKNKISHATFSGDMEQYDRDRALIKFRNGTSQLLIATDLAARGIDVPELKYIIHYDVPPSEEEFTHRNGRTARVNTKGTAYVMRWEKEEFPEFVKNPNRATISVKAPRKPQYWETLFISGGRKDKISKGDIAGLFFKQGGITKDQLGTIELKQDCAFVAIPLAIADDLVQKLSNTKLKKKKVRITILE